MALGLTVDRVEETRELHGGLDRLAAAARQQHLRAGERRQPGEPVGELVRARVRPLPEGVERLQLDHLRPDGVGNRWVPVADVRVPEARSAVDVALAGVVPDVDPLTADDRDLRAGDLGHVREAVPERCHRTSVSRR